MSQGYPTEQIEDAIEYSSDSSHVEEALRLAQTHEISAKGAPAYNIFAQLERQAEFLEKAYKEFQTSSDEGISASYAGEWILDNYYIIRKAFRQVKEDLPRRYYYQLPVLETTRFKSFPRVYAVAAETSAASGAAVDMDFAENFIRSYQAVAPLNIGELWAVPIMLRLAFLESMVLAVGEILRKEAPVCYEHGKDERSALEPDTLIAHAITSLRTIENYEWKDFFDRLSLVEQVLREDPADVYAKMDFQSRDMYRRKIETLAARVEQQELDVAHTVVNLADSRAQEERQRHIGYWLIDDGLWELQRAIDYRPEGGERAASWLKRHPAFTLVGGTLFLSAAIMLFWLWYALRSGASGVQTAAVLVLTLIPALTIANALISWLLTRFRSPLTLSKLDFTDDIPDESRTMVVIPALITSVKDIESLVQQMEIHFLQNGGRNIHFGLLTDFADADEQHRPEDDSLVRIAVEQVEALNSKYQDTGESAFILLHRERLWNASMNTWMGWERKRGKLEEFNHLILGKQDTSFTATAGPVNLLETIRYVITLDADTILTRGSARSLIGAMSHVLNRPVFDDRTGQVTRGYTVLQPRTEIRPVSANYSWFTRVFAGDSGIDLYSRAVSDVYQDWFGEGIYVGKGIYDVAAFVRSLDGKVRENTLLSHDLFEGIHGRAGLSSDIVLYEDYPPTYLSHISRQHRWIRGDWQLLPWLLRSIGEIATGRSPLKFIDLWKVIDNLRRSLLPLALMALLTAGLFLLPGNRNVWILFALFTPAVPILTQVIDGILARDRAKSLAPLRKSIRLQLMRWLAVIIFLPYETLVALDAIALTLVRVFFTRRNLLEWIPAAKSARRSMRMGRSAANIWIEMVQSLLLVLMLAALVSLFAPNLLALLLAAVWSASPWITYKISQPVSRLKPQLSDSEQNQIRRLGRRTWLFFEQFVGPEDHWLPPDHFQESPLGEIAHRTSPTNIGLLLTSTLGAHDLGYIGMNELILRVQNSLTTMDLMETYRGHLLNWYDTRSLEPLPPRYVSTVDSGNLIGSLIALKHGFLALGRLPVRRWQRWSGLLDLLDILSEMAQPLSKAIPNQTSVVQVEIDRMKSIISAVQAQPDQWLAIVKSLLEDDLVRLETTFMTVMETHSTAIDVSTLQSLRLWTDRLRNHLQFLRQEYQDFLPWLPYLQQPPATVREVEAWGALIEGLPETFPMEEIPPLVERSLEHLPAVRRALQETEAGAGQEEMRWCDELEEALRHSGRRAEETLAQALQIAERCEQWIEQTDFAFLFNPKRQIFRIGYNVTTGNRDQNYYDLLASEARIASLIAIGKREIPQSHWLHLGRPLTTVGSLRGILSWSGTMFEYLMPLLHTRRYENTLLTEGCYAAVQRQIDYGHHKGVPWGISESGYYRFDARDYYQYRAFGVPGLGLKRGLEDDLVISPYATLLALPLEPLEVSKNIERLIELGMLRDYGFYEAIDYTARRLPLGQEQGIVKSFMAHHQGMILVSIVNFLDQDIMVRRFHADPRIQSADLLLQEQVPALPPVQMLSPEDPEAAQVVAVASRVEPWTVPTQTPYPQAHYLSNGSMGSMITNNAGGFLRWKNFDLTRWRADSTRDEFGFKIYFQEDEKVWSFSGQETGLAIESEQVLFAPNKAELLRSIDDLLTGMEVLVAPDDDVEIRLVRITNRSDQPRTVRITSYAEVILAAQAGDRRHAVFNTLFIESAYDEQSQALHFTRRKRSPGEDPVHLAHAIYITEGSPGGLRYETDRGDFLGRGASEGIPPGVLAGPDKPGKTGPVLHPVLSLGASVEIAPQATVRLAYLTAAAPTRQQSLALIQRYQDWTAIHRAMDRSHNNSEIEMRRLDLTTSSMRSTQQLLSLLLYPQPTLRVAPDILAANRKGQPSLWPYAISGDFPILLARIHTEDEIHLIAELLQAHTYWRSRGLRIDLVIVNEKETSYSQEIQGQLHRLISSTNSETWLNQRGGIFILNVDQIDQEDLIAILSAARVVLDGAAGSVGTQVSSIFEMPTLLPPLLPIEPESAEATRPLERPGNLLFDNGYGGFSPDGREYQIFLEQGMSTPAPWSNIIANEKAGFLITERGGGYSWYENSGENRLSPWSNDPVVDPPGEALYLRDEESAEVWSPAPLTGDSPHPYLVRHGTGYTIFEHNRHGLEQEMRLFVAPDDPVKMIHLTLRNTSERPRRITAAYYLEWVLGVNRDEMQQYIILDHDAESGALLARNPYNPEFGEHVAFLAADRQVHGVTADRTEFLGRRGSYSQPAALKRIGLSGNVQTGMDPCAAMQVHFDLPPGGQDEVFFILGQGADLEEAQRLIDQYRQPGRAAQAWEEALDFWNRTLETVQVVTPDDAMNLVLNRWLLYQDLSCRVWGRSAFYQSSGAYGFRDQLQDTMALIHAAPDVAREHILRAARHQFEQGDVLHWWHPPSGQGVRTRITDDLLWLPYVVAEYVDTTGDESILSEEAPFLRGKPLAQGEEERYNLWESTHETYSILEHCKRAIQQGSTRGRHEIPLIGAGDWNDGMNRVGIEGRGESVWLGWFLSATLSAFAKIMERTGDLGQAQKYRAEAQSLIEAIDTHAWDGAWYLRGYYDDGSPLGASGSTECKIDAIAQSWSVLSQRSPGERSLRAMQSVWDHLVRQEDGLVLLFTPPFDQAPQEPGYIKGYPPGIRENGGQYTHAATWTVWAYTQLGQGDRAWTLFDMMNPICHSDSRESADQYVVEPYVIAADVYSMPPYTGRGGWTWYTGSGGWMYRLGLEAILGFHRQGSELRIDPCIPSHWPGFSITYRYGESTYTIQVDNPQGVSRGVASVELDGQPQSDGVVALSDRGSSHTIRVILGTKAD